MTRGPAPQAVPFRLEPRPGDLVRGDVWTPARRSASGTAIVVCHGFKGFKDWGFFPYLSSELVRRTGLSTVSFNFSGCGVGDDYETFEELDKFGHNTFSLEVADLAAVLDGLKAGALGQLTLPPVDRFGLFGHSRGGATALLTAAARPAVRAVVTWASISSVAMYEQAYADAWDSAGVAIIRNARTGQDMPLYRDVLDDIRANRAALDVLAATASLRVPYLIVHGTEDESVPPDHAHALQEASGSHGELVWIEGGSHTMNSAHPFPGTNEVLEAAIERTASHFAACLGERAGG